MSLTTDLEEFKNITLFKKIENHELNETLDKIFESKNFEEFYKEDPILMREYSKRRDSYKRKIFRSS